MATSAAPRVEGEGCWTKRVRVRSRQARRVNGRTSRGQQYVDGHVRCDEAGWSSELKDLGVARGSHF